MIIVAVVFGLVAIASAAAIASLEAGAWLRHKLPVIAGKMSWWVGQDSWQMRSRVRRWFVAINMLCVIALLVLILTNNA